MKFRDTPMQNLVSIREKEVCAKVREMLLEGESLVAAYKTVSDQVVFTTHRIFMVDMQGLTGTRQADLCAALPEDPAFWYSDDGLRQIRFFLSADGLLCRPA